MIVQPDFCDHWKTELLVRLSGSESAVRCLLRFWSHCQNRKKWKFTEMSPKLLASICRWNGDENAFFSAMSQTFLDVEGNTVTAHEWKSMNCRLIHNWEVGPKGGRPPKPKGYPRVSQTEPKGKPIDGLDREDKIDRRNGHHSIFISPSPKEVEDYSKEIGYPMNGSSWCDSYSQKGWMIGKNKMKDWKAAVRKWKQNGWLPDKMLPAQSNLPEIDETRIL